VRSPSPANNGPDIPKALAGDKFGNIYVTGVSRGAGTGDDILTVKINGEFGTNLWSARFNGPAGAGADSGSSIALDKTGDVYVAGKSVGLGTKEDFVVLKYGTDGTPLQVPGLRYNGARNRLDEAVAVAVDRQRGKLGSPARAR
jgi:hypothetical protein